MATISAGQQFRAVASLRWHLFRNSFRRKGGKSELAARIFIFPFAAVILLGVTAAAASTAYLAASNGRFSYLAGDFWAIFALQIVVSINIAAPGLSFDPESLIRFPLSFSRYLLVRLFLGLLSASTIVGTLALLAVAAGAAAGARASEHGVSAGFVPMMFAIALSLALMNMLFLRMVFAWVDRWLSTRRAREFFTVFILVFSLGIQYLNVTFNGFGKHQTPAQQMAKVHAAQHLYSLAAPVLDKLPPGLAGAAVVHAARGQDGVAAALVLGILVFAALCLGVFGWRMQREYRGENLSEVNHARDPVAAGPAAANAVVGSAAAPRMIVPVAAGSGASSPLPALLEKEWILLRRNAAQFYGVLLPLAMVLILRAPLASFSHRGGFTFPGAALYCVLGISALAYNVLGLDGAGVQFYFLSPVPFRTVFLAKNLFSFGIMLGQVTLLYVALSYMLGAPPVWLAVSTFCWVALAALVNVTVGNRRSITTPKRMDPSKISRRQASQMSALLALAIMLGLGLVGAGLMLAATYTGIAWLPVPILLALCAGAYGMYQSGLGGLQTLALAHRESLVEELTKTE